MDLNRVITWISYFILGSSFSVQSIVADATFKCKQQVCHECPTSAVRNNDATIKCSPSTLVSEHWMDNHPDPPVSQPDGLIDYACIKLTASNPHINGDSTDVIKGCVLRLSAESTCSRLVGIELARGKHDAKCWYCYGDECNAASMNSSKIYIWLFIGYLFKYLLY